LTTPSLVSRPPRVRPADQAGRRRRSCVTVGAVGPRCERVGVLGVPVSDQELQAVGPLSDVHEDVPGLLDRPCGGGVGGDAGQVNAAIVVLEDEQHVKPTAKDGVDVEEVDRGDRLGLGGQEPLPSGRRAVRCGVDAGGLEDLPDGGGRDLVAEACQLAADPPVAPGGVVAGHLQHEGRIAGPVRGRPGTRCR